MKLTKEQIKNTEVVGKAEDGSDVLHVETKGGFNIFVKKTIGDMKILGQGAHRGIARFMSNQMEKNIQWAEHLMKSEEDNYKPSPEVIQVVESSPDKHRAFATYSASMINKSEGHEKLAHTYNALSHFMASGLDKANATKAVAIAQTKLAKGHFYDEPYDGEVLKISYERKYKKPFPNPIED